MACKGSGVRVSYPPPIREARYGELLSSPERARVFRVEDVQDRRQLRTLAQHRMALREQRAVLGRHALGRERLELAVRLAYRTGVDALAQPRDHVVFVAR